MKYFVVRKLTPINYKWELVVRFTNVEEALRILNNLKEAYTKNNYCLFVEDSKTYKEKFIILCPSS